MQWVKYVAFVLFAAVGAGLTLPAIAEASAFTGAEEICVVGGGCGSAGGIFERGGRYYTMTVAHITTPAALGSDVYAYHPAFRYVGKLAYRTTTKDIALIDMGTVRPDPSLRIAASAYATPPGFVIPEVADIASVPAGSDWAYYNSICTTGWSAASSSIRTKCGYADNGVSGTDQCATRWCGIRAYSGAIAASADAGASGSPVWQPRADGQVRLLGFMSNCVGAAPCSAALFRPIYLFSLHNWLGSEALAGYPIGSGGAVVTGS